MHPPEYVQRFAVEHKIPRVFASLEAMAPEVDCGIIHGCDWGTHLAKAGVFADLGKAVLIDKPLAGNLRDLRQLQQWQAKGVRITGGSSLRFCREVHEFLKQPEGQRGRVQTALAGCGVDEFNYGIHAYAMLLGIMGGGAVSVRSLGGQGQRRIQITWTDGRIGVVIFGPSAQWLPFYCTIVTDRQVHQCTADIACIYRSLLEATLGYLEGTAEAPLPFDTLIEPELCALAARRSWSEDHREVRLDELRESDQGYDGKAFADEYRQAKYPITKG